MNLEQRFWSKVDKSGDCWTWTAFCNEQGYGYFNVQGSMRRAHRVVWELTHGAIPTGMVVLHSCDNPSCVRPEHLSVGTQRDNVHDRIAKGRPGGRPRKPIKHGTVSGYVLHRYHGEPACVECKAAEARRSQQSRDMRRG